MTTEPKQPEQSPPKHLAPYTCPKCGRDCSGTEGPDIAESGDCLGYRLRCKCGCTFTHWVLETRTPYGVEVDGTTYTYASDTPAATKQDLPADLLADALRYVTDPGNVSDQERVRLVDRLVAAIPPGNRPAAIAALFPTPQAPSDGTDAGTNLVGYDLDRIASRQVVNLVRLLNRLEIQARHANQLQHAGCKIGPGIWSDLFESCEEARALLRKLQNQT